MTPPENGKPLWTESQVESLLEDFFRKEMPPALREDNPSLPTRVPRNRLLANDAGPSVQPVPAASDRANSWKGGAVVVLSSLMVLMVGLMLRDDSPTPSGPSGKTVVHPESKPDSETGNRSQPGTPGHDLLDALRHNGQGPVELRPRLPHVGTGDPERSDFPELDIEVFPPDSHSGSGRLPENRGLPESGSSPETKHPMPEENHSLPESRSSGSNDVDEDDVVPMLPELRSQPPEPLGI